MTATENEERKKEIRARAKKVYNISFDYHLTHAVFGGDRLLVSDLMEANKETVAKLKDALKAAVIEKNAPLVDELMVKIGVLERSLKSRKHQILIEYVPMDDPGGGRVINIDGKMIIMLPKKIIENIMDDNKKLLKESVDKVRKKMAHELGHIVLHTDLVPVYDLVGSGKLDSLDWEAEVFAEELLSLYKDRDHRVD